MAGISIALVGCGRWGKNILRDLLSLGCDVAVVARSEQDRKYAVEQGAFTCAGSVTELPAVSGAVVATPTISHAEMVQQLLPRGIPIFVEKPLTPDAKQAELLCKTAGDRIFVMDKWRYHPGIEMLTEIARSEEFGPVEGLKTRRVQWGNTHSDVDGVWILAPHDLSIALEILGHIPAARCVVGNRMGDDYIGVSAILGIDPWFHMEVSTYHPQWRREIWLHSRDAIAVLDDGYSENLQILRKDREGRILEEPQLRPISKELPLLRELQAFVGYLQGGPPPRSSAEEGLQIVKTIEQLREMAAVRDAVNAP